MITILKPGKAQKTAKYLGKCTCACEFTYHNEDIENELYTKYINCPNCRERLVHNVLNLVVLES